MSNDLEDIWESLERRSTEDLVAIVSEQDAQEWRPEVFDMARSILVQRGVFPTVDPANRVLPADGPGLSATEEVGERLTGATIPVSARRIGETLGVVLITCVYPILRHALADPEKKIQFDVGPFVARTFSDIGWVLLLCWLLSRDEDFTWNLPISRRGWIAEAAWGYGLYLVAEFVSLWIGYSAAVHGIPNPPSEWNAALADPLALFAFRILGPISALFQELLFRVYLQTRLSAILGRRSWLSVPLAACLFAAVHGYPAVGTAAVFGFGLVLGVAYQVSGKIPRLVIAHAISLCFGEVGR